MTDFNIQSLAQLDKSRFSGYKSNLEFYEGQQWESRSRHRQLGFNYARISVDKITSYLMKGLNFACEPTVENPKDQDSVAKAESVLYSVYEGNNLSQLDYETEIDSAILGDGCYKVTWDVENKRIRITAPDMNGIYAWWYGDDIGRVWRVASKYQLSKDDVFMLYGNTLTKSTATITDLWTVKDFLLYLDND